MRDKALGRGLGLDRALEPVLAPLLALLDVPVEDRGWQNLDPPQRRQRTLEAVKRLLLRESQVQPLLVVFEDLHPVGLVAGRAHPGGSITGLSDAHAELVPQRLELLKEAAPSAVRVAVLFNPASPLGPRRVETAQAAAPALGMTVLPVEVRGAGRDAIDQGFETMARERATGIPPTLLLRADKVME